MLLLVLSALLARPGAPLSAPAPPPQRLSAPRAAVSGLRARVALLGLRPPPRSAAGLRRLRRGASAAAELRPARREKRRARRLAGAREALDGRLQVGLQGLAEAWPHTASAVSSASSAVSSVRADGLAPLRLPASPEVSASARFARSR